MQNRLGSIIDFIKRSMLLGIDSRNYELKREEYIAKNRRYYELNKAKAIGSGTRRSVQRE